MEYIDFHRLVVGKISYTLEACFLEKKDDESTLLELEIELKGTKGEEVILEKEVKYLVLMIKTYRKSSKAETVKAFEVFRKLFPQYFKGLSFESKHHIVESDCYSGTSSSHVSGIQRKYIWITKEGN